MIYYRVCRVSMKEDMILVLTSLKVGLLVAEYWQFLAPGNVAAQR